MRYRQAGRSGLTVSVLGLGCNNFGLMTDQVESGHIVHAALDAGITLFDTAPAYGGANRGASERFLGEALKGRRHEALISTKVSSFSLAAPDNAIASRRAIIKGAEASLQRLQTDYIDVLYLHQPDVNTPIEESIATLDQLASEGKILYGASSNLNAWQLLEADFLAWVNGRARLVMAQSAYSLMDRAAELDLLPVCAKYGIGFAPYFPLAHGLLTGKYRKDEPPPAGSRLDRRPITFRDDLPFEHLAQLEAFAAERGLTLLQVALGGLAAKPAVCSMVAGASTPEQVRANAAASDWIPSEQDVAQLDAIARPEKYIPLGSRTAQKR
jgi:aryl-alcohol dehydrogenase-like predicted oxidoreductase